MSFCFLVWGTLGHLEKIAPPEVNPGYDPGDVANYISRSRVKLGLEQGQGDGRMSVGLRPGVGRSDISH